DLTGQTAPGQGFFHTPALTDPAMLALAASLASNIDEFRQISFERHEGFDQGADVGIGSSMDVRYDAVFGRLLADAESLESSLEVQMRDSRNLARGVFRGGVVAWCLVVGVATFGLWTRERRRLLAVEALRHSQHQLAQSQKMDAVGRLAGGLAHDLNNYLAAVRGQCELVALRHGSDAWIGAKMDAAIRVVNKASVLIERLQTFSRKQPLQLEVLNLNPVVSSLEKMMAPSVGENIRLETALASDLWNIRIDPTQIEQVLVNFVLNAQEAMPDGGSIRIRTANTTSSQPSREEVLLEVTDTGTGIPDHLKDKIFEPFLSTKGQDGRRGLGLAIVYSIVEQQGGRLEVESAEGEGTTFRVFLPRCSDPVTFAEASTQLDDTALKGTECILLVDDNDDFRESTRNLLEALGYRVLCATGGDEALEVFRHHASDIELVLTDVVMPGMNGPELLARMREQRDIKALLLSGHTDNITVRAGVDQGEVHFLKKLFFGRSMAVAVRELLDGGS
ncbi:MAG: response regulator, partial [Acidobacteria bacterium]|nr:response regulator [Acidobacteriota bacterium]